ncbi:FIG099352: hypothetical protein [hydrothermal vent metagenome]|uniref:Nickel insertion protein n=1 Tax=hydrothermal vent metagenome TaxID=652676 RepID=A0A3B1C1X6_9ZZZZ
MRLAYFDCFNGVSGDMILGAMVDAGLSVTKLRRELKKLGVDGYTLSAKKVMKCGISATKVYVRLARDRGHKHRHYSDITKLIRKSQLEPNVVKTALAIFKTLAEAEARVHDVPLAKVHFHEVGAVDSIVDIVGAAIGFTELGIGEVMVSAINVGSGVVKTEHGVLPIPAPATAFLLQGIPSYAEGPVKELATPTGAAILKTMASRFGSQPLMTCSVIGIGAGGYDFDDRPNILRMFIGAESSQYIEERLIELATNIDDMNPQALSLVSKMLFDQKALDVTITPIHMKKGRAGMTLKVLCDTSMAGEMERIIFKHTSTLGIRRYEVYRVSLTREIKKVKTKYGVIEVKVAYLPNGEVKAAPEFESVRKAAEKHDVTFDTVYRAAL